MKAWSEDLRHRVVEAYRTGVCNTYSATAKLFGVGIASVNRWLRLERESGDLKPKKRGGKRPRHVDLNWLREHATQYPDDRLIDRVAAWEAHSQIKVHLATMSDAMRAIGWSYKKKHQWLSKEIDQKLLKNRKNLPRINQA